jgi:hypothetical protein
MARVIGSERNLVGGREGWSPTEFADLQSINKILSTSDQICQSRGKLVLSSNIPGAMNAVRIKRRHLQASRLRMKIIDDLALFKYMRQTETKPHFVT